MPGPAPTTTITGLLIGHHPSHPRLAPRSLGPRSRGQRCLPPGPCSVDEARARHANGEVYAAVLRDPEAQLTLAGIELEGRAANVSFLDGAGRLYLRYSFGPAEDGKRMFLQAASFIEYADDVAKESIASESYHWREDGTAYFERSDKVENLHTQREGTKDLLDRHYEPLPAFGDYASIFRVDRDKGLDEQSADSPSWQARETPVP